MHALIPEEPLTSKAPNPWDDSPSSKTPDS